MATKQKRLKELFYFMGQCIDEGKYGNDDDMDMGAFKEDLEEFKEDLETEWDE